MPLNNDKSPPVSNSSNPNPRNSETINPMRRSFSGNPFSKPSLIAANPRSSFSHSHTPANSPSDFSRKSFVDDKENAKDQFMKPAKVRSPAATSKSTKNFMSPTISASFKMAESPRKKILAERNEPTPTSDNKVHVRKVTFSDPLEQKRLDAASLDGNNRILFPSFESEDLSGETLLESNVVPMYDLSFDAMRMNVPMIPNNDSDFSFETVHTEPSFQNVPLIRNNDSDFVNLDPTFKLSPATATPPVSYTANAVDPLIDTDPSVPPYDPKTNYLSPRPQFLHYKPKPRMELEDSFDLSGNFSDTDVTEYTQSDESQKESSEDVSSDETVKQEDDQISEQSPVRTLLPEKTVEAKELRKPRFSLRSKVAVLILLLSTAFVSISIPNSPGYHAVLEDFYEAYESSEFPELARANFDQFSQFAKANFEGFSRNLHTWYTKSLSSISELISDVRGVRNMSQLQYFNLTVLHDYSAVNQSPIFGRGENKIGYTCPPVQETHVASEISMDEYFGDISAEHYEVYEEQLQHDMGMNTGFETALDAQESEEVHKGQPATYIESEQQAEHEHLDAKLEEEVDANFEVGDALESEEVLTGQSTALVEPKQDLQLVESVISEGNQTPKDDDNENMPSSNSEIQNEVCGESNVDTKLEQENDGKLIGKESDADLKHSPVSDSEVAEIHTDGQAVGISAGTDAAIRGNEQLLEATHSPHNMVLYLLLCAGTVFIAGATFNWSRKVKSRSKKITSCVEKPKIESEDKKISPDKPSMRNVPVEMDVVGESCPSEMSSFEKSSSSRVNHSNEAISVEKKRRNYHRRESLASSDYSMGSPSYGSLTVYEKIPKGRGEEEIVTPVRRSSRIRSIATSPV
ncbi:hypothetical protein MtrunA17_Chr4g0074901 [Medicago truncatula]|uniref:Transmembrane protein, putative n=1 Tax=Medicago truncatula TaxID=3880 RepID=G7JJ78_MEDTR|nr:uncharacterized protein LOC11444182 [Medicago truncatula]AES92635.1 transmembrane protein, putative [Medicago truncatula]RHN64974.1 hypothetical protein MtrunA17_Chr4g0074901 [Medicago truncatula]